jgi:hypothetical protein
MAGVLCFLLLVLPARAELVILGDGSFFKVKDFQLDGEHALLTLRGGGRMTLPIERVERVLDDEVLEPEPPAPQAALAAAAVPALPLRFDPKQAVPEGPWGGLIWQAARRNALNPMLVAAVIRAESAGNPRAVSRVGARGLMQLMPATAERFGVRFHALFEPEQNLEAGSRYLSWLVDQFPDDLGKVLAAYNAGENAVARYGGIPPYRETRNYVRRIYANLGLAPAADGVGAAPGLAAPGLPAPASRPSAPTPAVVTAAARAGLDGRR